jgi:hypothetical protein
MVAPSQTSNPAGEDECGRLIKQVVLPKEIRSTE